MGDNVIPIRRKVDSITVDHDTSRITHRFKSIPKEDFGERMQRIRDSFDKINKLLAELKGRKHYEDQ